MNHIVINLDYLPYNSPLSFLLAFKTNAHPMPDIALKIPDFSKRPFDARARYLEAIRIFNDVFVIEKFSESPAHGYTIRKKDTFWLLNKYPNELLATVTGQFNVNQFIP